MSKKAWKKGGGKRAGMTEEERLLNMQQKAQAEADIAKRKEDMLTHFVKDKLQKEEKKTSRNVAKLRQQWRAISTQAETAELRDDISVLSQSFEKVLDCNDKIIKSLVDDLSERAQQSELARSSHLQNVDCLLKLHKSRLAELASNFNTSVGELSSEYNTEREQILSQHQQESVDLENVMFHMEKHYADIDNEARRDYEVNVHQIKQQSKKEKQRVKKQMKRVLSKLWTNDNQLIQHYNDSDMLKGRKKIVTLNSLDLKNKQSEKEIDAHNKQIQELQEAITAQRCQLSSSQSEGTNQQLRSDRDKLAQKLQHRRVQLAADRTTRRKQLTKLTIQSNNAAKKLQETNALGERLMRRSELCRKMETEHEKVLPFYKSSLSEEELSQEKANAMKSTNEKLPQLIHDYSPLGTFWQRYNKVQLDSLCLKREKGLLLQENEQLKINLQQYMDELSVSGESLQQQKLPVASSSSTLQTPAATERRAQKRHVLKKKR
ncbi:dynein regulatory complex subunit 2-like [Rhinichthys klamathensis goyatoka]|uniref:dynein regulatory complex subunit 2-like n=1 Tax=Rhinichthys klamathensis goyatoka TaxID=3034132 RepID=UPI0024B61DBD|nr:dynein regulatory complex subunit 2-like [Rhinichthys klamathensis goyatoka]